MSTQDVRPKIIYDGDCGFCRSSVRLIKKIDWFSKLDYVPGPQDMTEMRLDFPNGRTYSGFFAFRRLTLMLPMLYPMILLAYFPGSGIVGPMIYRWIARNRYLFPGSRACSKDQCKL